MPLAAVRRREMLGIYRPTHYSRPKSMPFHRLKKKKKETSHLDWSEFIDFCCYLLRVVR